MKEVLSSLSELIRSLSRIVNDYRRAITEMDERRLREAKIVLAKYSDNNDSKIIQSADNLTPEHFLPIIEKVFGPGAAKGCAERLRQIQVEGWTPEHDDQYNGDELVSASVCYMIPEHGRVFNIRGKFFSMRVCPIWPWDVKCWKPTPENRIRELEKGIALGMAEIDRLERKEESK